MRKLVIGLAVVLFLLHQDTWLWNDSTLYLGFIPSGLGYHIIYCFVAAGLGLLANKYCWPEDVEAFAEKGEEGQS